MEPNFKKIIKPNIQTQPIQVQPTKVVNLPTYDELSQSALTKNRYLSEFKTPEEKQRARENLGIGNNFKVIGSFETVEALKTNVPIGDENEAYLVGDDIYTWSNSLKDWFKYGAAGSSAYDIAVANGFIGTEDEWLASLGQSATYIIENIDEIDNGVLFNILQSKYPYYQFYATEQGNLYQLDVSKINQGFIIQFAGDSAVNTIKVQKIRDQYISSWNYILLYAED